MTDLEEVIERIRNLSDEAHTVRWFQESFDGLGPPTRMEFIAALMNALAEASPLYQMAILAEMSNRPKDTIAPGALSALMVAWSLGYADGQKDAAKAAMSAVFPEEES